MNDSTYIYLVLTLLIALLAIRSGIIAIQKREINSRGFGPTQGTKAVLVGGFLVLLGLFAIGIVLYQLFKPT